MKNVWNDDLLQHAINLAAEYGREEAGRKLGVQADTIRRYWAEANERGITPQEEPRAHKPNILILDIETSLMTFFGWSPGQQYVGPDQIITDWYALSWACKWLFEPEVYSDVLTPEESLARDDKRIIESIWAFIDKADILVIHNARFDVRKLNARFIYYDVAPPGPFRVIDTLKIMRKEALFSSNKQGYLAQTLSIKDKLEHEGYKLWIKCYNGDPEALLRMEEYNKGDILSLEELYIRIRPYIKNHPNMNLFVEGDGILCPNCGGKEIEWINKFYYTNVNKYSCFRCKSCSAVGRSRETAISKADRVKIASIAR